MTSNASILPMPETQKHYSDYGFDSQIDYFQVLHEARKQGKREVAARPPEAFRFKLQKPISKDDRRGAKSKKRGRWWRNAILFWKRRGDDCSQAAANPSSSAAYSPCSPYCAYPYHAASRPVYVTESGSGGGGWAKPCRRSGGGSYWGSLRLTGSGEVQMPYLCLRDLAAMDGSPSPSSVPCSSPAMPIYLVT